MWEVTNRLYIGDRDDARDGALLSRNHVTHVLNCAADEVCHFPQRLRYLHLELQDPDDRFGGFIEAGCAFIDEGRQAGGVLVHCSAGVSRSAAMVLAWLCCRGGYGLEGGATALSRRVLTNPDDLFLKQLAAHLGTPLDGRALARLTARLLGRG